MKRMNKNDLIDELNSFPSALRLYRDKAAGFVLKNPEIFSALIDLTFEDRGRLSVKAAWILELVCTQNLSLIYPHLDDFSRNMKNISDESALRPLFKVVRFIAKSFNQTDNNEIQKYISQDINERLTEVSFDCLIEDHKIASQVSAMDTLYYFGKENNWIHPELRQILIQNLPKGSKGYQSHAKMLLKIL